MRKINIIFLVLTLLCMGAIFYFSSKTREESEAVSDKVEMSIGKATVQDFSSKSSEEQAVYVRDNRIFVRKAAHALEYTILCILVFLSISFDLKLVLRLIISFGITLVYAISDEFHQYFVPGRTALVSDVIIDLLGVAIAVVIIVLFCLGRNTYLKRIKRSSVAE